ncbi:Lrp/AsnC family transcriptional regulator [Mesorhizobium retamae]|uniref:Lrp/AsnC family transcriptional regulator n=1 Tax=Mesorhizobium retamae TaxID=2912854 RepID=A0ABS9Q9H2_9HYPH|nr:Lrp/AsnC family transcriptional regulator [Mesorhizobium sp. IRAMC:0171]MCG7503481.1 Lrp/AsnC family transcriptional regulator [Mesorhizobium sp. IRAMC:0171]
MRQSISLDPIDRRILEQLQIDARLPVSVLAERVGLSSPACYRRIRHLRENGTIQREVAVIAPRMLGWPLSMIVLVTLEREGSRTIDELLRKLEAEPQVIEAWQITGEYDFAVKIVARDMESYDNLVHRLFASDERIRSFVTLVVIRSTKKSGFIPISKDIS